MSEVASVFTAHLQEVGVLGKCSHAPWVVSLFVY